MKKRVGREEGGECRIQKGIVETWWKTERFAGEEQRHSNGHVLGLSMCTCLSESRIGLKDMQHGSILASLGIVLFEPWQWEG
jgi:hypothetical protein